MTARSHLLPLLVVAVHPGPAQAFELFSQDSPSMVIAGAYFPAWLVCSLLAVVFAIVVHGGRIAARLTASPPLQLLVCLSIGALVGSLAWMAWTGF